MGHDTKIIDIIRKAAGTHDQKLSSMVVCEVTAVDVQTRTCTCTPVGGTNSSDITNVLLMAVLDDGLLLVPEVGSNVIIQYSPLNQPYVAMFGAISQAFLITTNGIQFQGGEMGGLVMLLPLLQKINDLEEAVNDLKTIITDWTPVPDDGGLALKTAATAWAAEQMVITERSDLENTSIKQGQ